MAHEKPSYLPLEHLRNICYLVLFIITASLSGTPRYPRTVNSQVAKETLCSLRPSSTVLSRAIAQCILDYIFRISYENGFLSVSFILFCQRVQTRVYRPKPETYIQKTIFDSSLGDRATSSSFSQVCFCKSVYRCINSPDISEPQLRPKISLFSYIFFEE